MGLWSQLLVVGVALVGWFVVHWLNVQRDQRNKKRELRIQYLIEAYRRLERSVDRPGRERKKEDFESAIADIQLFGTSEQIRLAVEVGEELVAQGTVSLKKLLPELRRDLREELDLQEVDTEIKVLTMHDCEKEKQCGRLLVCGIRSTQQHHRRVFLKPRLRHCFKKGSWLGLGYPNIDVLAMKITSQEGKEIPFLTFERGKMITLGSSYFAGPDGGKEALEKVISDLYENPNIPFADMYLLQQPFHMPAKFLTPEFEARLRNAGAVSQRQHDGIIILPQSCPKIIMEAEDEGWIKTKLISRYYQMEDCCFVHIPKGPRITKRTFNPDPEIKKKEFRCVTDKEQKIVDSSPEYHKLEIRITEKTKRKFQLEEMKSEMGNMSKIEIGNFTNYGNATFGDKSPIISPIALESLRSTILAKKTNDSFTEEIKGTIVEELKQFSKGQIKKLSNMSFNKLIELAPALGDTAAQTIDALSKFMGS